MKFLTLSLIFLTLLFACGGDSDKTESTTETGKVMESDFLDTCQCIALVEDSLGNHTKDGETYTGICLDYYPESQDKYIEKNLLNGKIHGKVTYYDRNGEILIEEIYEEGNKVRSGEVDVLTCNCSELKQEETHIPQVPFRYLLDDIPYTGNCIEYYHESDQVYLNSSYKDGVLHGHTVYYKQDGSTLMIENYEKGILMSVVN